MKTIKRSVPFAILFVFCTFGTCIYGQHVFTPDVEGVLVSELILKNGDTIRGRVVRVVPGQEYEIRTISRETFTIRETEIDSKTKTFADIRESRSSYNFGLITSSPFLPEFNSLMPGFVFGYNYDFGKDLKYSFMQEFSNAFSFGGENNLLTESFYIVSYGFAFGYKHNRNKKHSQAYYLGPSFFFTESSSHLAMNFRYEYARKIGKHTQLVPFINLTQSFLDLEDINTSPFLTFGLILKYYFPVSGIK